MSKTKILVVLGIWLAVLPYLGFPLSMKNMLVTLTGFGVLYISFLMYGSEKANSKETFENFSENPDFAEETSLN